MVTGTYAECPTGEELRLDMGQELGTAHKQKNFAQPSWRSNLQSENQESEEALKTQLLLAGSPNTTVSVLDSLASADSPLILERIAENPHTSAYTLSKLAFHDNPRVRAAVAENSNLPESIMWRLAGDVHPDVRL